MLSVIVNPNPPKAKGAKRRGFDVGYAMGVFDKCAGNSPRDFHGMVDSKYNRWYGKGYVSGYMASEVNNGNGS